MNELSKPEKVAKKPEADAWKQRLSDACKSDTTKIAIVPYDTLGKEIVSKIPIELMNNVLVLSDLGLLIAELLHLRKNKISSIDKLYFIGHTQDCVDFAISIGIKKENAKLVPYDKLNLFFNGDKEYNYVTANGNIMKFVVIIGNPPYNPPDSSAGGEHIWDKFVSHSWNNILNDNGYLAFVTPSGWRHASRASLSEVYEITTKYAICWKNCKAAFGNKIGTSIDTDWWIAKKYSPVRNIMLLPRSSDDVLAMSIFSKLDSYNGKKLQMLHNGFDRNEKSRGSFRLAQTSKYWMNENYKTCSKKGRTHDKRKVIYSSSGATGAIYNDGDCSTSNHSHAIAAIDAAHGASIIKTLNSKTASFIARQLAACGSLENPIGWIVPRLPDADEIDVALGLTQEEIDYVESIVK